MLKTFVVEYLDEDLPGQVLSFEVEAEDIEDCYDILNDMYGHIDDVGVYLKGTQNDS